MEYVKWRIATGQSVAALARLSESSHVGGAGDEWTVGGGIGW
jgi:hypothetical protein